jgi:Kef-type K+ transport system membrane component KefB
MLRRRVGASKVKTSIVVQAVILFVGLVAMAYGYFHNDSHIAYLGLFVTGATSFTILVQTLISQNSTRRVRKTSLNK